MLEELKEELREGKKVYLFQLISICLFIAFLGVGVSLLSLVLPVVIVNSLLIGWLVINLIVITVYSLKKFIDLLFKEQKIITSIGKTILYKVLMFLVCFSMSGFIFLQSAGMAIPVIALGVTGLVLAYAKEIFPSKKGLMIAGIMWFSALFFIFYFTYPLIFMAISAVVSNVKIVEAIMHIILIAIGVLLYLQFIKKVSDLYTKEELA